jgi:hypothetical protein
MTYCETPAEVNMETLNSIVPGKNNNPLEVTLDSKGVVEKTYGRVHENLPEVIELLNLILSNFPNADINNWEMVGITKADDTTYFEDTVALVYKGVPSTQVLREFLGDKKCNDNSRFSDFYMIKYQLESKTKVLKVYDECFGIYQLPKIPEGIAIQTNQGIGVHFGSKKHENFRDFYFVTTRTDTIEKYATSNILPFPENDDNDAWKTEPYQYGWGITFDAVDLKPIKLKRYFFPHDPTLKKPLDK